MPFSYLEFIDWSALAFPNLGNVHWVYCDLKCGVAATPLLPSVPYVVWPIPHFATASLWVPDYFGYDDHASGLVWATGNPAPAVETIKLNMAPAGPASTPLPLDPLLLSSSLPVSPQAGMVGSSSRASTFAAFSVASSLDTPASSRVAHDSSAAGPSFAVDPLFVDLGAALFSGTRVAMAGRSSTSLVPASFTLSRPSTVVMSGGSLPSSTNDAGALDSATLSHELATARRQCDAARQKLASVQPELHRVRAENDELWLALAHLHGPVHESGSSLLPLVFRLDAITTQCPPSNNMRDGSF